MDSFSCFLIEIILVVTLYGTSNGQPSPVCSQIASCLTPEFQKNIRTHGSTKELCRSYQGVLSCLNPKIEECLPTLPEETMAKMFTQQRDTMQTAFQKKCADEGITSSSAGCQEDLMKCTKEMTPISEMATKGNIDGVCKLFRKVKTCFADVKSKCPNQQGIDAIVQGLKSYEGMCGGSPSEAGNGGSPSGGTKNDCSILKLSKCFPQNIENASTEDKCKAKPKGMKCLKPLRKCDGMVKDTIKKIDEAFNGLECSCAGLKASWILALAASIMLALRSRL